MREIKTKSAGPIYTIAIAWLLYALCFPLYELWHFLVAAAVTGLAWFISTKIFKPKITYVEEPVPEADPITYGEAVDAIIAEGKLAIGEMSRLRVSINDLGIKAKIDELMIITDKIIEDTVHDPSDVPQVKRFLSYYIPTTIKLLNAYDRMSSQGIEGKNITGTMHSIEEMLDRAVEAYKKQLDSLFANQALDIETDIEVMNQMLRRESLSGDPFK